MHLQHYITKDTGKPVLVKSVGLSFVPSITEYSLNVFTEFSDKKFVISVKGFDPAASCVRDWDGTTAPARLVLETGYLNWLQFIDQI